MNAIELLKEDHNELRGYFQNYKASDSDSEKHEIFEKIKAKLDVHTHIEETVLYPKIKDHEELEDITLEGIEEHHLGDVFVREISGLGEDSEKFEPKMEVLIESIEHHLMEEEGNMFPKIEKIFDESTLEEMGEELEKERKNYKKSHSAGAGH